MKQVCMLVLLSLASLQVMAQCGGLNKRPCKVWERVPSCNKGLVENFKKGKCVAKAKKKARNGTKVAVHPGVFQVRPHLNEINRLVARIAKQIQPLMQSGDFAKMIERGDHRGLERRLNLAGLRREISASGRSFSGPSGGISLPKSLVITAGLSAAAGVGAEGEIGLAISLSGKEPMRKIISAGFKMGLSFEANFGASIGLMWEEPSHLCGSVQGVALGVPLIPVGVPNVVVGLKIATNVPEEQAVHGEIFRGVIGFVGYGHKVEVGYFRSAHKVTAFGSGASVCARPCGALNQRPCTVVERFPSCDRGLVERFGQCTKG